MNDCFNRAVTKGDDDKNFPLHAGHPSLSAPKGRSAEQIARESDINTNKPLINPKTGGRK